MNKPGRERAPQWARTMMRRFGVSGWAKGHALWLHTPVKNFRHDCKTCGKIVCVACGQTYDQSLEPCYGGVEI